MTSFKPNQPNCLFDSCRAPYKELEPHLHQLAVNRFKGKCFQKSHPLLCVSLGAFKTIYKLQIADAAQPDVHNPNNPTVKKRIGYNFKEHNRSTGVCCNHYRIRSEEELWQKLKSNTTHRRKEYLTIAGTPDAKQWYQFVPDTRVWQYLPDLARAMRHQLTLGLPFDTQLAVAQQH